MATSKKTAPSKKTAREPITSAEIEAVASKLEKLAVSLPPKEQALLNLLLVRADNVGPIDAKEVMLRGSVKQSVAEMLNPLVRGGTRANAWVEAGDPWVQSAWVEAGDPWVQSGTGSGGWVEAGDPWVQSGSKVDPFIRVQSSPTELGRFLNPRRGRSTPR